MLTTEDLDRMEEFIKRGNGIAPFGWDGKRLELIRLARMALKARDVVGPTLCHRSPESRCSFADYEPCQACRAAAWLEELQRGSDG